MREVLWSAYDNDRDESFKIIDELEAKSVEILISDHNRTMGYRLLEEERRKIHGR